MAAILKSLLAKLFGKKCGSVHSPSCKTASVLLLLNNYLLWLLILHATLRWAVTLGLAITLGWAVALRRSVSALRLSIANKAVSLVFVLKTRSQLPRYSGREG